MSLPVNLTELISGKIVKNERIEYKAGWNPGAIYRTICAFANDFSNIGGGYIIIGAKARNGIAERQCLAINQSIQKGRINGKPAHVSWNYCPWSGKTGSPGLKNPPVVV